MTKSVITVEGLSVSFNAYDKPSDFIKELVLGGVRHDTFWALRDVSLTVREGERVGIVGPNGAGKSTLLQTIAGNLKPTAGSVTVDGSISSLLSLVPAWNLEESGIENIEFNLLMRGVAREDVEHIKQDIIEFTDLGPFIYNPVKTYSSGMSARLSFAIATAIQPDILIIDEVLGTGDGYFAGRATKRLQEMCKRGRALLFVSHATAAVRMMCDRCVWIENGSVRLDGPAEFVLRQYEEDMMRQDEALNRSHTRKRAEGQINLATPEEVGRTRDWRLRIRPEHGSRFTDTHYIKDMRLRVQHLDLVVPLETTAGSDRGAHLDTQSCEWGRIYEKHGQKCRMLLSRAGMRPGGHISVARVEEHGADAAPFTLSFLESSILDSEPLAVEVLDPGSAQWRALPTARERDGEWFAYSVSGTLPQLPDVDSTELKERAALALRRPVEIVSVDILLEGRSVQSVPELRPFSIVVQAIHHERMPGVSINLNVIRADGAYVFYQPSGLNDGNIVDHLGRSRVVFDFSRNPFAPGEYEINVFATDAFNWEDCPPQDIFDRSIGAKRFKIDQVRPIPFGLINSLVPVGIETFEHDESGGEGAPIPLRFPPPFRQMVAFNSDVEWTSWRSQLDLMRIFADRGLETAFSYWFFGDPRATWRMFEGDGTPSAQARAASELIKGGLLDTLHSYGGVLTGGGRPFGRVDIERALATFRQMGLTAEIYSNHGGLKDVQNIGGPWCSDRAGEVTASNYQSGDVPGSSSYHLDLTQGIGVRHYWLDVDCISEPLASLTTNGAAKRPLLFTTQQARDGTPMSRFKRSNFGLQPLPSQIEQQLRKLLAEEGEGYAVVYNHFGFLRTPDGAPGPNPAPYFSQAGFGWLDKLAEAQSDGKLLVTTTKRLLAHAFVHLTKPWLITRRGKHVEVAFTSTMTHEEVRLPLRWSDLHGFAIPAADIETVHMSLNGETRPAEFWVVNGVRYAGIRWRNLPAKSIIEEVSRHET